MSKKNNSLKLSLAIASVGMMAFTGCQVHIAGQTLPSPYYLEDDVQYFLLVLKTNLLTRRRLSKHLVKSTKLGRLPGDDSSVGESEYNIRDQ